MLQKVIVLTVLSLMANLGFLDNKTNEKIKFDLIDVLEDLVNIEGCYQDLQDGNLSENELPRSCNYIHDIAKYDYTKKNKDAIVQVLRVNKIKSIKTARRIIGQQNPPVMGKMILSKKCYKGNEIVDLDDYLKKVLPSSYNLAKKKSLSQNSRAIASNKK